MGLTWGQVDLKEGFIRLNPEDTKANEGRLVPVNRELVEMFQAMSRGLSGVRGFYYQGQSVVSIRNAFHQARQKAGIEDFTFHDLRHTFINDRRVEGHDYFRIMAATGHKTMSVFKQDNTVSKDELKSLVRENR